MVIGVNPFLVRIFGDFGIKWSGVLFLLAVLFTMAFARWMLKRQKNPFTTDIQWNYLFYSIWGALIGGRVGYCIFFSPDLFIKFRASAPFWGFLAINEGGLSFHGAMLGLVVVAVLMAIRNHLSSLQLLDLAGISLPLGIFWARLSQLLAAENIGRETSSGSFLAMKFPAEIQSWLELNYKLLPNLAEVYERLIAGQKENWILATQNFRENPESEKLLFEGVGLMLKKYNEGDQVIIDTLLPIIQTRYPASLYAAVLEGLVLFFILFILWKKSKPTGMIFSLFLVLFSIFRFIGEYYQEAYTRTPVLNGLTLLAGLTLLFLSTRTSSVQSPGWGRIQGVKLHRK